ncbi:unnamed protein product, partial [Closterium sp. NIES-65]
DAILALDSKVRDAEKVDALLKPSAQTALTHSRAFLSLHPSPQDAILALDSKVLDAEKVDALLKPSAQTALTHSRAFLSLHPSPQDAILALDSKVLDAEKVDALLKFCPAKEEAEMLKLRTGADGEKVDALLKFCPAKEEAEMLKVRGSWVGREGKGCLWHASKEAGQGCGMPPEKLGKCEQFILEMLRASAVACPRRSWARLWHASGEAGQVRAVLICLSFLSPLPIVPSYPLLFLPSPIPQGCGMPPEKLGKCEQFFLEMLRAPRIEAKLKIFEFKLSYDQQWCMEAKLRIFEFKLPYDQQVRGVPRGICFMRVSSRASVEGLLASGKETGSTSVPAAGFRSAGKVKDVQRNLDLVHNA